MRPSCVAIVAIAALAASGCARQQTAYYNQQAYGQGGPLVGAYGDSFGYGEPPYQLDSGDRVRVIVYGQEGLNNSYVVDPSGLITLPMTGAVEARGLSKDQLAAAIGAKLKQGYIREPHVAVEIETYRPFFILGEVNAPGQYPFVASLTIQKAVAIAGGFSPRADKRRVTVTRMINGQSFRGPMPMTTALRPGDTIQIEERWF